PRALRGLAEDRPGGRPRAAAARGTPALRESRVRGRLAGPSAMHLVHRKTCRVCQSSALTKVIDLGEQYLQGSFVKPDRQLPPMRRMPTSLVRCDPMLDERACGLLQMEYTVPPEVLYSVYWYRSGTNSTMRNHLAGIAQEAAALLGRPK